MQLAPLVNRMVLIARRLPLLLSLADSLREAHPGLEIRVVDADLSSEDERNRLASIAAEELWFPDLLINNAGLGDYGEFLTSEWEKIRAMLDVNIVVLTHLTHLVVPGMAARGGGALIHVSSLASLLPIPDFAVYAATKAYVSGLSEALRIELRGRGIDVLAVCPGPVHTEFGLVARRGPNGRGMPARECFYVTKERVVAESLRALEKRQARVYPGMRIKIAAGVISAIPLWLMRRLMALRPRRIR